MTVEDFYNELFQEIKATQVSEEEGGFRTLWPAQQV